MLHCIHLRHSAKQNVLCSNLLVYLFTCYLSGNLWTDFSKRKMFRSKGNSLNHHRKEPPQTSTNIIKYTNCKIYDITIVLQTPSASLSDRWSSAMFVFIPLLVALSFIILSLAGQMLFSEIGQGHMRNWKHKTLLMRLAPCFSLLSVMNAGQTSVTH